MSGKPRKLFTGDPRSLFLMCWLVPTWVVFELITSKLVHYTLPMYPAVALLSARVIVGCWRAMPRGFDRLANWVWAGAGFAITSAVAALTAIGAMNHEQWWWIGAVIAFVAAALWIVCTRGHRTALIAVSAWVLTLGVALQVHAPVFAPGQISARIMNEVRAFDPHGELPIASMHQEDSMLFWTRGRAQRVGEQRMREFVEGETGPRLAVIKISARGPQPFAAQTQAFEQRHVAGPWWFFGPHNGSGWLVVRLGTQP